MFERMENENNIAIEEWSKKIDETQERWFVFLDKLEVKMEELCSAAIPELTTVFAEDTDIHKRSYIRMLSGIKGQLEQIRQKAYDVREEKVRDFYYSIDRQVSVFSPLKNVLFEFMNKCGAHYDAFEEKCRQWQNKLDETSVEDLEIRYQNILKEYENIKDKFQCKQCGGKLSIDKLFFISTYITCPFCQTQNTFEPGTQAKQLEHLGRRLAEQRCAPMLQEYNSLNDKERELYQQIHKIKITTFLEADKNELQRKNELMSELEKQRQDIITNAPLLYEKYLRAMFDEWNKIVPDLKEQNEKFYESQLRQYRQN
jgi:hypothetical protein